MARPKQILLWAATGLIWLTATVGGPTLLVFPFFIRLIGPALSTPSGIDFLVLSSLSILWLIALITIGLMHHGKARWAHFAVAVVITSGVFAFTVLTSPPDARPQILRVS